jgi:hypothetical protein
MTGTGREGFDHAGMIEELGNASGLKLNAH